MVPQVTVIGILMIVNGSLQTLMGIFYAIMGPLMFSLFTRQGGPPVPAQAEQVFTVFSIIYVVLGSAAAVAGIMNIAGGIAALKYRSRGLVITALFFNLGAFGTCYCIPTSLGLMIWGLIVMFQGDVTHAFTLGASGYTVDEIKQRMGVGGYYRRGDDRRDDWEQRPEEPRRSRPPPKGAASDEHIYEEGQEPPPKGENDKPPPKQDPGDDRIYEK